MSEWTKVGALQSMPEDEIIPLTLGAEDYIIVRRGDDVSAFRDICSHQDIKLSEFGEIQQGVLVCHAHGAAFDCQDGRELCFPATAPLFRIPVRISGGHVELHV